MIPVDEGLYKKLCGLYPSLNEDELRLICKKNYNNELAVMGDLSAKGYRPIIGLNGSDNRSMYTVLQNRTYSPHQYTGSLASSSTSTIIPTPTASVATPYTTASAMTTTNSGNGTPSLTAITARTINTDITNAHNKNPALIAAKVSNSSPTPALANSSTSAMSDRSNSPQSYWCINTAKRTYSPIVGKTVTRPTSNNPAIIHQQTNEKSQTKNGSNAGTLKSGGRYYYPGRFVQGVGFEPNSMGGSPRITGKPFIPLQGRYVFGGMINDRSYSPKPQQAKLVTRDPNFGSGHQNQDLYQPTISPPPPPNPPPISLAAYAAYAKQAEAAGYGNIPSTNCPSPNRSSPVLYQQQQQGGGGGGSNARPYNGPIPSWYGEEERIAIPVQRLHHDFIKNRITDRSASPPVASTLRTYSPIFGLRDRTPPPPMQPSTVSSSPYHHYQSSYHPPAASSTSNAAVGSSGGSSFYATASRLYTQSPKPIIRSTNTAFSSLLPVSANSTTTATTGTPYPHYHGPITRPQVSPSPPPTPLVISTAIPSNYHSPAPSPAYFAVPPPFQSRTYLPYPPSADGYPPYPVRSSPAPGSHSPKIKLRYLRRIYPGVDETILLDVLANADNNVQTAMQELGTLGYVKIETPPVRAVNLAGQNAPHNQQNTLQNVVDAFRTKPTSLFDREGQKPIAPPRRMTEADKQKTRARMLEKVKEIPADILTIALESVNFDEDRALVLLNLIKLEEGLKNKDAKEKSTDENAQGDNSGLLANLESNQIPYGSVKPVAPVRTSQKSADQTDKSEKQDYVFKSRFKSEVKGPNNYLRKGPNSDLLIKETLTNQNTQKNSVLLSKGPNKELRNQSEEDPLIFIPKVKDRLNYSDMTTVENIINREQSQINKGPQRCLVQGSTYKIPF